MLPNSNIEKYRHNQLPRSNQNKQMTIHPRISSDLLTGKCFSLFSLNHNKSRLLFISSSNHKHIRNMNLEVFSRVVMRLGFQKKYWFFLDNKMHILKNKNIPTIQLQRTYMLSNHHFLSMSFFLIFFLTFHDFHDDFFFLFYFFFLSNNMKRLFLFSTF